MRLVWTLRAGFFAALATIAALTAIFSWVFQGIPYPSPPLLREMVAVGATIFLAYVIQATWMVRRRENDDEYELWLGFITGMAVAGLIGIVSALLVAEHRAAGHGDLLDDLGLWWTAGSLGMLSVLVAFQPWMVARWTAGESLQQ